MYVFLFCMYIIFEKNKILNFNFIQLKYIKYIHKQQMNIFILKYLVSNFCQVLFLKDSKELHLKTNYKHITFINLLFTNFVIRI